MMRYDMEEIFLMFEDGNTTEPQEIHTERIEPFKKMAEEWYGQKADLYIWKDGKWIVSNDLNMKSVGI